MSNVTQFDADQDGVGNECDNCPIDADSDQVDSDEDGIGDECDLCRLDPTNDPDGDGVCDNLDNCIGVTNIFQLAIRILDNRNTTSAYGVYNDTCCIQSLDGL